MSESGCGPTTGDAILSVDEIRQGRGSDEGTEGDHRYVRAFVVVAANALVSAKSVREATGIPALGDTYEITSLIEGTIEDTESVVVDKTAFHPDPDSQLIWHVVVSYERSGVPTAEPPTARWTTSKYTRPVFRTVNGAGLINQSGGDPITNSAGDPFIPPTEAEDNRAVYHRSYWLADGNWSEEGLLQYKNAINDSSVTIGDETFPAHTLKVADVDGERRKLGGEFWWRVNLSVEYRPETWDLYLQDAGYKAVINGKKVEIQDCNGAPITEPAFLDGDGGLLVPCDEAGGYSGTFPDPVILGPFQIYPEKDFSALNLQYTGD